MRPELLLRIAGAAVFAMLGAYCFWRGFLRLRKAQELEVEPRFRKIAFMTHYTGLFLLLFGAWCAAMFVVILVRT